MSQNDYIKIKKNIIAMSEPLKLPYVLPSNDYTIYKSLTVSTNVKNDIITHNDLSTSTKVFGVDIEDIKCLGLNMCKSSNQRGNRILTKANPELLCVNKPPVLSVFARPTDKRTDCNIILYCDCENTLCNCSF